MEIKRKCVRECVCVFVLGKMPRKFYISGSQATYFLFLLQRMTHGISNQTEANNRGLQDYSKMPNVGKLFMREYVCRQSTLNYKEV